MRFVGVIVCKPVYILDKVTLSAGGNRLRSSKPQFLLWANGRLPWSVSAEQKHFWQTVGTEGPVVMGATTLFDDFGKLNRAKYHAERVNIVLSSRQIIPAVSNADTTNQLFDKSALSILEKWPRERTWVQQQATTSYNEDSNIKSTSFKRISSASISSTTQIVFDDRQLSPRPGDLVWINSLDTILSGALQNFLTQATCSSSTPAKLETEKDKIFVIGGDVALQSFMHSKLLDEMLLSVLKPHVPLQGAEVVAPQDIIDILESDVDVLPRERNKVVTLAPCMVEEWEDAELWEKNVEKEDEDFVVFRYTKRR